MRSAALPDGPCPMTSPGVGLGCVPGLGSRGRAAVSEGAGDLLSDAGYVVYRNADLTAKLMPVGEAPTDFGLDAVFVVTDFNATMDAVAVNVAFDRSNNFAVFSWKGNGRVSQLYRAAEVTGPWEAWTPIFPGASYAQTVDGARGFFRLRQW